MMKSYRVVAKIGSEWEITDTKLNQMYAECVAKYYADRGHEAKVEEE